MTKPSRPERAGADQGRPAHDETKRPQAEAAKKTQFDGNPNPEGAPRSAFKPQDDTPLKLQKKPGPRTGRA